MSQTTAINYGNLEEFLQKENSSDEEVKSWYEKLLEYEIDGSESAADIEILFNGARYVMSFAFTAAEELRDVAEQEAVTMAEKEDKWEEEKLKMKEEIERFRETITSKAEIGDSTEAFRAQIDSLKEENRQLQQSNRDRDREMADQRDRFESLAARVDLLTRERDSLSDHKVHLEDTIRELNRRLSSKTEESGGDWESKKLKLRNEQVMTMSRQMQAVVSQNDELREEIERVSYALEEATRIIEQSAKRYSELATDFENCKANVRDLELKNKQLTEGLPDDVVRMIPQCLTAAQKFMDGTVTPSDKVGFLWSLAAMLIPNAINEKDQKEMEDSTGLTAEKEAIEKLEKAEYKIKALQEELSNVVEESNNLRSKIREDRTGEKEQELEHLKKELMAATTLARNLFGEAMSDKPGQDPTTTLQMRILQLEHAVQEMRDEIETKQDTIDKLQFDIENKDEKNMEILTELNRFKDQMFGTAREEISRLETQIQFRNEQIAQLQQHCTLLQVELGQYADNTYQETEGVRRNKPRMDREMRLEKEKEPEKKEETLIMESTVIEDEISVPKEIVEVEKEKIRERRITNKPVRRTPDFTEVATQAMLISNLYYEMMELLEEISMKDKQLVELHNNWKLTQKTNIELKSQLELAYEDLKTAKKEKIMAEENAEKELRYTEGIEFQRLVESINIDGTEMERRLGEATRKLITEKMERIRLSRQTNSLKVRISRLEWAGRKIRESMREEETKTSKKIVNMKLEIELAVIEIGKLHNKLLRSVSIEEYDEIMRKYKKLLKQSVGIDSNDTDPPRPSISILSKPAHEKESEAKEHMLKKMVDVVTGQSEFWNREAEILQAENDELKHFLEDLEKENDSKSVLSAVERRLLDTIRDLRDKETQTTKEKKKQRSIENERIRDLENLKLERVTLLNVINVLKRENKILRNQSMGSVSLQQLEILRNKIIETHENEIICNNMKTETEKLKESANNEYLMAKSLRNVLETENNQELSENAIRQLQIAFFNSAQQSAKCRIMEKTMHLKERKMIEINEEIEELKKWNMELLVAVENFRINDFSKEIENVENLQTSVLPPIIDKESDYESEESSSPEHSSRVVVRTIVQDNLEQFEYRIKELRDSAQVALQGYKDQLDLKNNAIQRYKQLLAEKINEESQIEIVEKIEFRQDPKLLEKLEKSEKNVEKLRKQLENARKSKEHVEIEEFDIIEKDLQEIGIQTEEIEDEKEKEREKEEEMESERAQMNIMENNEKSQEAEQREYQMRNEIRDLKSRCRKLSKNNKELLITCEKIKEDALQELSNFRKNNENSDERRATTMRIEIDRLKSTIHQLRQSNEILKAEITRLRPLSESNIRKSESSSEWERRKKQEETINGLKTKMRNFEISEKQMTERIEKREKMIETLKRDQTTRNLEIEKLQKKLKENDPISIKSQLSTTWQRKVTDLESKLQKREDELQIIQKSYRQITIQQQSKKSTSSVTQTIVPTVSHTSSATEPPKPQHTAPPKITLTPSKIPLKNAKVQVNLDDRKDQEDVRSILRITENRLIESQEKLISMEKDYLSLAEKFDRLKIRSSREDKPTGAVLVLSDKLQAKDREIAQLKNQIAHLQRTVQLPI